MNIYSSENIEILAEKLACDIRDNSNRDIFASPVHRIIIPSLINKNWLNFELLKYNDVLFRTEYDTLSFSPYRLAKEIGIRGLDQTATEKDLFFEILAILSDSKIMSMPAMACVYEYIDDISRELRRVKTYQFAEKLSKIFLKYIDNNAALYNKNSSFDVIGRWNEYIKRNTEPYNLEETDWSETEKCEFIIYSQMIKSRLKNNSETNITRLSILREFDFSKAKKSKTVKLYVFDYPYISKGFAETLKKMSEFIDINIYINPVNEKLLGSDNSIQKKYFENFENLGYEIINLNPASDPLCISKDGEPCDSTVGGQCVRTQSSTSAPNTVLSLFRSGKEEKTDQDKSFQILSCPGMDREAECVYNSVIKNLEEDPTLKP
ncbi:MAG: exodeoxyribonuclease V subunit gamma, partial [Armatimonadetes bacterium]|nr:exodeoxyribonuclease V subunit gamma [Candidatus Hippobium faecium]